MEILSMISILIKGMKEHYWGFQLLPQHQKEPKKKKKELIDLIYNTGTGT